MNRSGRLRAYFAIAFVITWTTWLFVAFTPKLHITLPFQAMFFILVVGSFGPFIAAFFLKWRDGGVGEMLAFASRALRFRIGLPYLLGALFLLPLLGAAATWIYSKVGGPPFAFATSMSHLPMLFVTLFFLGGSVGEEFGWAYATDIMVTRWRPLLAMLLLGSIWAVWHLPLFFIAGTSQSHLPFAAFFIGVVSMRVMYAWAYEGSRKSILATLLFHTAGNMTFNLYALVNFTGADQRCFIAFAALSLAAAALIAARSRLYRNTAALAPA